MLVKPRRAEVQSVDSILAFNEENDLFVKDFFVSVLDINSSFMKTICKYSIGKQQPL